MGEQVFLELLEGALREHPEWVVKARERVGGLLDTGKMAALLDCSKDHLERLVESGELREGKDYIDVGSKDSTRRMLRFRPEQVVKTLAKPARMR